MMYNANISKISLIYYNYLVLWYEYKIIIESRCEEKATKIVRIAHIYCSGLSDELFSEA